jgi:putative Holliday junction resolvase
MIDDGRFEREWDAENRMVVATEPGIFRVHMFYDHMGRRIRTTRYNWDSGGFGPGRLRHDACVRPDACDPHPFRFGTKFFDTGSRAYCYGYRWHDPQYGRWLSRHPNAMRGGPPRIVRQGVKRIMAGCIGIDYGLRRIGLAIGDDVARNAMPLEQIAATGDPARDADAVIAAANDYDASLFVVGLPLNMDDSEGRQSDLSRRFAEALQQRGDRPVHMVDERLTSFGADEVLNQAELTKRMRKANRDRLAAQIVLQRFFDSLPSPESD